MAWDKKITMAEAVKSFLVTGGDGKVDMAASTEKFRVTALQHLAKQESDEALIMECMTSIFDQFRGANLNLDFIKSETVNRMAKRVPELADPSLFTILQGKVEDVLHENTNQPATEATEKKPAYPAIEGRIYSMRKGKGGGFFRVADQAAGSK